MNICCVSLFPYSKQKQDGKGPAGQHPSDKLRLTRTHSYMDSHTDDVLEYTSANHFTTFSICFCH